MRTHKSEVNTFYRAVVTQHAVDGVRGREEDIVTIYGPYATLTMAKGAATRQIPMTMTIWLNGDWTRVANPYSVKIEALTGTWTTV